MFFQIFRFGYERQENCVRNEGVCAFLNKMLIFYYSMCCWSLFVSVDKHVGKHFQRSHLSCIVNQFDRSAWKLSIIFPKSLDMQCGYIAKCYRISIRDLSLVSHLKVIAQGSVQDLTHQQSMLLVIQTSVNWFAMQIIGLVAI